MCAGNRLEELPYMADLVAFSPPASVHSEQATSLQHRHRSVSSLTTDTLT